MCCTCTQAHKQHTVSKLSQPVLFSVDCVGCARDGVLQDAPSLRSLGASIDFTSEMEHPSIYIYIYI